MSILSTAKGGATFRQPVDDKAVKKKAKELFERRSAYTKIWQDIKKYQLRYIGRLIGNKEDEDVSILNNTAYNANEIFAAGVMSGLTPPSRQWFKLTLANSSIEMNHEMSMVLDKRHEVMQAVFAKSNFYTCCYQVYLELAYGQGAMALYRDSRTGIRAEHFTIGTYAMAVGANGIVNTFAVKRQMTISQMVEQFGEENLPQPILAIYHSQAQQDNSFDVMWLVQPNPEYVQGRTGNRYMKYSSYYWVDGYEGFLEVGGFNTFPVCVARYSVSGTDAYARGAGWHANDDAKMLQKLEEDKLRAVELMVKPPMQVSSNLAYSVNLIPGGLTMVDNPNDRVQPLFNVNTNLDHLELTIQKTEERIRRAYHADLFLLLDQIEGGQMTAREVMERTQEKLQQLGPVVERLQYEFLNNVIERAYAILSDAKIFEPIPEDLQETLSDQEVKVDFTSPLAQAQKMAGITAIEQGLSFAANLMQMFPEVRAKMNPIGTLNEYMAQLGAPASMFVSDEEAQQTLQAQQQAEQEQQAMQMQMQQAQQAPGMAKAVKDLSDASQANPALEQWLGMPGLDTTGGGSQ